MNVREFTKLTSNQESPSGISPLLLALWHAKRGDWEAAHNIAQDIETSDGSWVHAYLHRVEGDEWNAGYWYRRAGREFPNTDLNEEWESLVAYFLKK